MPLPRLRPAEAYPVRIHGRPLICLRDLDGVLDEPVFLPPRAFLIASLLDGRADVVDVQAAFARHTGGELLLSDEVVRVVEELDRLGLLDSEGFRRRRQDLEARFRASAVRPAHFAGRSYPADPQALRAELDGYLAAVRADELAHVVARGVIAPHIDFSRGGWCYGRAHRALAAASPRRVLILGVAHGGGTSPFILTRKAFQTPLGTVPVDRDLADLLEDRLGDLCAGEFAHRAEHSIEFQVVFLQHLFPDPPAIVPVLCALGTDVSSPRALDAVEGFVGAVREAMRARDLAILASVDFSHVGPRFGDPEPADHALAVRTAAADRVVLGAICAGDADAFWAEVSRDGNPRRVDAVWPVYLALRLLSPCRGRVLGYGQAPDPAGGLVTFASIALI
ncbi:MAG: AmmeMemoRadiSam system protein B [Armatimonadota bacterium]|nr:AmmeMemoRadiSam system protein B [Armatimonadota bacterium]MDR7436516.1 AmmeMemoRadiSam system protein B [Armatimonadota bacterium]MDR7472551.1 AmmeMemoRadiSam system protein B [Armatimonadota bacterium]MDR7506053.1 AmmeMemoRadiSam system protein B [Armatimonadota bacterium]MDR7508512.1 AmmeMemoRadiSam system protein B [Armatimonadota bacterium]